MSRPISRSLLRHSATLETYKGTTGGGPTYNSPAIALSRVRFQAVKRNAMTSLGDMKNDRLLMFFDAVVSEPHGQTFDKKDRITFDGMPLSVRQCDTQYGDDGNVHHFEVYLE